MSIIITDKKIIKEEKEEYPDDCTECGHRQKSHRSTVGWDDRIRDYQARISCMYCTCIKIVRVRHTKKEIVDTNDQ